MKIRSVLLLGAVSLWSLAAFAQATKDVNVVNTPNVNVVNTPTVNVGNSPSVSVSNTPSVSVAGTAMTKSVDEPARQPYNELLPVVVHNGNFAADVTFSNIPNGKTLVVEHVSMLVSLPIGESMTAVTFATQQLNGASGFFFFAPANTVSNTGTSDWVAGGPIRTYVNGGGHMAISFGRNSTSGDSTYGYADVTGYLVNN